MRDYKVENNITELFYIACTCTCYVNPAGTVRLLSLMDKAVLQQFRVFSIKKDELTYCSPPAAVKYR